MPICPIVQSVLSEWEITCGRAVCRSRYSRWYSAGFSALCLRALAWLHSNWIMMQLLHDHLKCYETWQNSVTRQIYIYSDFCNLLTLEWTWQDIRKYDHLWKRQVHCFICSISQPNWTYTSWNYCALERWSHFQTLCTEETRMVWD